MQLAIARADVALDAAVLQDVPIAPRFTLDGLIHVAVGLGFRDLIINGDQATVGQDANGFAKHDNPAVRACSTPVIRIGCGRTFQSWAARSPRTR